MGESQVKVDAALAGIACATIGDTATRRILRDGDRRGPGGGVVGVAGVGLRTENLGKVRQDTANGRRGIDLHLERNLARSMGGDVGQVPKDGVAGEIGISAQRVGQHGNFGREDVADLHADGIIGLVGGLVGVG